MHISKSIALLPLLWLCASFAYAEECPAPRQWFSSSAVPTPGDAEPRRGVDCDFYQRAWQQFLFATESVSGKPRFFGYKSYSDLFGRDDHAGLFSSSVQMMVLAPRTAESAQVEDAEDVFQAGSSAILIDQNSRPIFYNIIVNPTFEKFIVIGKLNNFQQLKATNPDTEIPVGAVEFKAAWQIVSKDQPPTDRIVTQAQVPYLIPNPTQPGKLIVDRSKGLRVETVALIGLHVVFRPVGHPEMVWATFEYDQNAPSTAGNPKTDLSGINPGASCQNPSEPRDDTVKDSGKPYILYKNGTLASDANLKPKSMTVVVDQQLFQPTTSIVRAFPFSACFPGQNPDHAVTTIDPAVSAVNQSAKSQLHDVLRNSYSLVGAVWMDEPNNPNSDLAFGKGITFDDFQLGGEDRLSSTSMESFTQISAPNCFVCHNTVEKGGLGPMRINVSHIFRRFALQSKKPPVAP